MNHTSRLTQAIIDLDALVENYQYINNITQESNTIAVIKADAYGHDAIKVAQALSQLTEYFAVGFIDEALALRDAGISNKILILEGPFHQFDFTIAHQHNFTLMLHSHYQITWLNKGANNYIDNIWLKLDTGMNRLGFDPIDIEAIITGLTKQQQQHLVLCSHYSSAEQAENTKSSQQFSLLKKLVDKYQCQYSIANSAGILNWPSTHGDYTRLGLAMYGISPISNQLTAELNPVMTLEANIIAIKTVHIGQTVGYGDTWQANRETRLATVAIGYADGYPRNTKSGTPVYINNQIAPIVGRVSMDMITVDITDLSEIHVGDMVELWGKNIPINTVAQASGRVNYELLTQVSKRVPKIIANEIVG